MEVPLSVSGSNLSRAYNNGVGEKTTRTDLLNNSVNWEMRALRGRFVVDECQK